MKSYRFVKLCFDFVFSIIALVIFSPLFLIISLVIYFFDGKPIIFSQKRIGLNGKPFLLYKFRTMHVDAEKNEPKLCIKNDIRVTKIGKFLREHHLDELPQLWNVLKGDMSFVGYRPEREFYIDIIKNNGGENYSLLFNLRPGLFSQATLYNGYADNTEKMLKRLEIDLSYLQSANVFKDTVIIFKSAIWILIGKKF